MVSEAGRACEEFGQLVVTDQNTVTRPVTNAAPTRCFHCGNPCNSGLFEAREHTFCCQGCRAVFELLTENGLTEYYTLDSQAGVRTQSQVQKGKYTFLDDDGVRRRLVSFSNDKITRVVFRIPAIHCIACVWLLENLFRLNQGIAKCEVNFLRKEATLTFTPKEVKLSEVVGLLASLGYEPELKFSDLESAPQTEARRRLWLQLGVAGFAFGNNMLFAIALYLGVDAVSGPAFRSLVGYISLALALPVLLFSAQDYFRLAWQGLKQGLLTIETPIAAGIVVIFVQSAIEALAGRGVGYFDSFAGLLFFLLCGRLFQQKTYERLAFDRDFKSFFPLSVTSIVDGVEKQVSLSELKTGDRLLVRNGELIPADCKLLSDGALIDYSFVTGEAEPVSVLAGEYLYAGGRQMGGAIELETVKPVSQSYLTSLWNQDIFTKKTVESLETLINRFSQRFTRMVLAVAIVSALFWLLIDPSKVSLAFSSVLIVACPCALALAAPFALGTAIRVFGRRNVFVKSPQVIERLAKIDTVVFDKTGTLTAGGANVVDFHGTPLSKEEKELVYSIARQSVHAHAVRIANTLSGKAVAVRSFRETTGCGIEGGAGGQEILIGSAAWIRGRGIDIPESSTSGSVAHMAFNGNFRGTFALPNAVRNGASEMVRLLSPAYGLALLSGDNEREREKFATIFGPTALLRFNQSPLDKLDFVRHLQAMDKRVLMVGDGLNDAGALKQSDVGVAVVESVGAFSPASDVIMRADMAGELNTILRFSKGVTRIVLMSFGVSTTYNILGITIAASANLAPIVCAILMPLSSLSVVAFACGVTSWYARHLGLNKPRS